MNKEIIFYLLIGLVFVNTLLVSIPMIMKSVREKFKKTRYNSLGRSSKIRLVRQVDEAVKLLSKTKTGAIISIVNKDNINHLRTDGIKINASISSDLIIAVFNKNSPLHDGAMIIDNNEIIYVATYYKITKKILNNNRYGARHRAAMGMSEVSDALTVVVSEETGRITLVKEGKFISAQPNNFQEKFTEYLK